MAGKPTEEQKSGARLGSILLISGLVTEEQMSQAMEIGSALALPLGKALVMLGILSSPVLIATLEMQSLLKDKLIDISTIKEALKLVKDQGLNSRDALARCGWKPKDDTVFIKLGELLLDAGIITKDQLEETLAIAANTQMPLGRVLIVSNFISHSLLWSALNAQVLIRDSKIDRNQAIEGLKAAHQRQITLESSLLNKGLQFQAGVHKIKLGDILVMSGMLSEQDLLNSLESCLFSDKPMGEVLIENGLLSRDAINTALKIQELVSKDSVPPVAAGELLKRVCLHGKTLAQAVAELTILQQMPQSNHRLGELLKRAGMINDDDINEAVRQTVNNSSLLGKILVATGQIEERTLVNTLRCQFLLKEGLLPDEAKAIQALSYCQRMHCSFDEALKELKIELKVK